MTEYRVYELEYDSRMYLIMAKNPEEAAEQARQYLQYCGCSSGRLFLAQSLTNARIEVGPVSREMFP